MRDRPIGLSFFCYLYPVLLSNIIENKYNIMKTKVSLGIDIGGTNIAYGLIDK